MKISCKLLIPIENETIYVLISIEIFMYIVNHDTNCKYLEILIPNENIFIILISIESENQIFLFKHTLFQYGYQFKNKI